jgi:hypothetical protein
MTKPVTGQYEFLHRSGVGLDYFTSRIDRLTLLPNGRFTLTIQDRSRLSNAAKSLLNGEQITANAPEIRREGSYTVQGNTLSFLFDDGGQERGLLAWNGEGMQFGPNFFDKISDSTMLPPTHRLKKDMDDIAKGLKIASTIGGLAMKAVKTVQDTVQSAQEPPAQQTATPAQQVPPRQASVPPAPSAGTVNTPPAQQTVNPVTPIPRGQDTLFCDQCGARVRPGKRFCNNCGAQLP